MQTENAPIQHSLANVISAQAPVLRSANKIATTQPTLLPGISDDRYIPKKVSWISRRYKYVLFLLLVILPTCFASIYYVYIASKQYVTEFTLGIRTADPTITVSGANSGSSSGGAIGSGGSSLGATIIGLESYVVTQFAASREMADMLDTQIGLRKKYTGDSLDFWSKLNEKAPEETFTAYWQTMVDPYFDITTGAIDIKVRAFTPQDSLDIANAIIENAMKRVSDTRDQSRKDELRGAQSDLAEAERRVSQARVELRQLRERENIFDPQQRVVSVSTTADKLRDDIATMQTEIRALSATMAHDAPTILVLQNRIAASTAQLKQVEAEITDKGQSAGALTSVVNRFNEISAKASFAETAYQSALQALAIARTTADREQLFLVNYVKPSMAELSVYPDKFRSIATVFAFSLAAWFLATILIASLRDHAI